MIEEFVFGCLVPAVSGFFAMHGGLIMTRLVQGLLGLLVLYVMLAFVFDSGINK